MKRNSKKEAIDSKKKISQLEPASKSRTRNSNQVSHSVSPKKISHQPEKDSEKSKVNRSRRKSAEKPVKYEESSLDDTEDELVSPNKVSTSKEVSNKEKAPKVPVKKETKKEATVKEKNSKVAAKKEIKKPISKLKPKLNQQSSSDEFEGSMSDDSEHEPVKSASKSKDNLAQHKSRKIISPDSDLTENVSSTKKNKKRNTWMEVYLEQEEQWMSVDVVSGQIHCDRHLERNASDPVLYVVAFNPDLTWKDVTARYASSFLSTTRKQRAHPTWAKLLNIHREKKSPRSTAEDESLTKSLTERPMPTSISEFKNHPLYALQRHLLKVCI